MSDAPISRFSRVMSYPIPLFPWRRSRPINVRDAIANSELPATAQQLITEVVRRTRLWAGERGEVALELIAHFHDGLEAGRSAEELMSSFGSIKTAARLIRRGKRRNRPLWWHARRRVLQAIGAIVLLYIGLALLLVVRHPNPTVEYIDELNRPMQAASPADCAWPIYREAWTKTHMWSLDDQALYLKDEDGREGRSLRPQDVAWPDAAAFLQQHKPLLDAARAAGLKPTLGWELKLGPMAAMAPADRAAFTDSPLPAPAAPPTGRADQLMEKSSISILLPFLAPMRMTAVLLAADMRLAASEGDADRVLTDYRALTGMARQVSATPILVNQQVGLGIIALADQTLMEINQSAPQSLTNCRVDLVHAMAATTAELKINFSGERLLFLDMLQRVYSDDGHGDGSPTLDGLLVMARLAPQIRPWCGLGSEPGSGGEAVIRALAVPGAVAAMASRKEMTEQAERIYAMSERDAARPLWVKLHSPAAADTLLNEWHQSLSGQIRYPLLMLLVPSLSRAGEMADRTRALHEAAMIALSLEAYRDKTGRYPATLADIVPHYFPTQPLDYSTGGPLQYKLLDGKPLLYGLGKDGVDDGGVWTEKKSKWPSVPDTGDWVLYPPVEESH